MDYKANFASYQKAMDEILHDGPTKINNVLKSRSISPALPIDELAETLKQRIDDYEERGRNANGFDDYTDYSTFVKDIGERTGRCIAHGIILADALVKGFSVKRSDKIGRDLKVTSAKVVSGDLYLPAIRITYTASRLTFVAGICTVGGQQQSIQTAINPYVEIEVKPTDPSVHFPPKVENVVYLGITDVEKDIIRLSKELDAVINSQFK